MLVKSGRSVMLLLALSIVTILLQNAVGSGVMALMGKNPLYGLGCGSISMIGGLGTAAAIGSRPRRRGCGRRNDRRRCGGDLRPHFRLRPRRPHRPPSYCQKTICARLPEGREHEEDADDAHFTTHSNRFVLGFLMLAFCVGLGSYVTTGLTKLCGFNFPAYIGPMLVAVAVRNLIDHTGHIEFPAAEIGTMGNMFLAIFLSMALSGLKLWAARGSGAADACLPCR